MNRRVFVMAFQIHASSFVFLLIYLDFEFLLRFLRIKKYSQVVARQSLVNFMANITDVPEWLSNLDPADIKLQEILRLG